MSRPQEERVYRRGTATHQQHFQHLKRQTKGVKRAAAKRVSESQSTLTQIEYCTPSGSFVSRLGEDEDGDYQDEAPKRKKQKTKQRLLAQKTLTQMISSPGPPIPHDDSQSASEHFILETQWQALPGSPEIPSTHPNDNEVIYSTPCPTKSDSMQDPRPADFEAFDNVKDSPMTPKAIGHNQQRYSHPSTLKKFYDQEVPETPQTGSSELSIMRSLRRPSESPLKDRGGSQSPCIVASSMKTQGRPSSNEDDEASISSETPDNQERVSPIPFRKPLLPLRGTQARTGTASSPTSRRKQMIVEDSQIDEIGDSIRDDCLVESTYVPNSGGQVLGTCHVRHSQIHHSSAQQSMPASVYDPVMSALNRDEARFGQTQTRTTNQNQIMSVADQQFEAASGALGGTWEVIRPGEHDVEDDPGELEGDLAYEQARKESAETIDLTSDIAGSQMGTPTSTAVSPERPHLRTQHAPVTRDVTVSVGLPRPSQATTVDDGPSNPPSPSRIPQTYMPRSYCLSRQPLDTSSPPRPPASSPPQANAAEEDPNEPPRSSFTPYTYDTRSQARSLMLAESSGARRRSRRLKRGEDILPDSLLDFTIPNAPAWMSSPPMPLQEEEEEEDKKDPDGSERDEDDELPQVATKDFGHVDLGIDLSSSPPVVTKDYSLDPPSSDWRSSGRSKRS
ncbi:hypothetical protein BDZ85DRAFT_254426 [Elsinoe ampelina]|uniref:Uncharacterized protein n=1 Tax=Elsinoe ampelina TaxID=302913 RepID=A0A6A6GP87_9PEZI|nr:hypothetical protein BDZ85DRAFT_254426 [Elsinoe ampelina]